MKHKAVIVDDEKNCVEVIQILLEQNHPEIEVVATFASSRKALDYLKTHPIDLLFLDIQMPFMTGIELIQQLPEHYFQVIFTTAFDQYALSAIKLSALDYLLKPIDEEQLRTAVEKYKVENNKANIHEKLNNLIQQTTQSNGKITVSLQDKIMFYKAEEILYCQSTDNYTTLFLTNGEKVLASKTIKHFEEIMAPLGFLRPHQSYLINRMYIEEYNKKDGGFFVLKNDTVIPVSRQRKEEILQLFKNL